MSSMKSKVHLSLTNKAFTFSESPLSAKLALKTFEDIGILKDKSKSSRSASPPGINILKPSSFTKSQDYVHSARTYSQDRELINNKRPTLPILQTIKVYRESNKQKQTPKSLGKKRSGVSDSSQSNFKRTNRSPDKTSTKLFRIRTSTSSNHLVGLDILKSSKSKNSTKNQGKKAGSMPVVGDDLDLLSPRSSDIGCMCFNTPSQTRTALSLLIIHFEGILGSCLIQNRDNNKENSNKENNVLEDYLFIRKDVKDELKQLSKKFLIAIVFPSLNNKYKTAMKFLINRKFCFDGAYYVSPDMETSNQSISKFILNYKKIVSDFKAAKSNKKILILLPLNLSLSTIKNGLISANGPKVNMEKELSFDKSCFHYFFPKIQVTSENLKIVCLPNFLLEEKNESYSSLFKSEFSIVSKLALQICQDNFIRSEPRLVKKGTKDSEAIDIISKEKQGSVDQEQLSKDQIDANEIIQFHQDIKDENLAIKGKNFKTLNLASFFKELNRIQQLNTKLRKIEAIKGPYDIKKEITNFTFDQSLMRQKFIEDLAAMQRQRIALKGPSPKENGGVLITGVVGDLFTWNANIIRIYEKDSFYSNKKETKKITDLTEHLNNEKDRISKQNVINPHKTCKFPEEYKEQNDLRHNLSSLNTQRTSSDDQNVHFPLPRGRDIDDEEEALSIQLIQRLASEIYLHLDETQS